MSKNSLMYREKENDEEEAKDLHRPLLHSTQKNESHVFSSTFSSHPSSSSSKYSKTETNNNSRRRSTYFQTIKLFPTQIQSTFYSCCSMPFKMPTPAREAFAFISNIFGASTSSAQISTELTTHNGKTAPTAAVSENGKTVVITEQPRIATSGNNSTQLKTTNQMPPTGKTSPTDNSRGLTSDELSDDSIVSWEPDVEEKELVKKTWSDDFDFLYELGAAIYTYIFENNPNTKKLFPAIHQHGERWKESKEFRQQALRFVQTLSHAVKNLYHMDRLAPYLYRIGELHVKYAKRGFQPAFWDIFLDAMEVSISDNIKRNKELTEEQKKEATRVWRRLALYVITHMKRGYNDLLKKTEAK